MAIDIPVVKRVIKGLNYPADGSEIEKEIKRNFMSDEAVQLGERLSSRRQLFHDSNEAVMAAEDIIAAAGWEEMGSPSQV